MAQKSYQLDSPDGKLKTVVNVDELSHFQFRMKKQRYWFHLQYHVLEGDEILGLHAKVAKVTRSAVNKVIPSPFYKKGGGHPFLQRNELEF